VPLALIVTPLITTRKDAPQQTMVLSSNQSHTGTFGFRGEKFSIRPNFCATVRKTNRKVLQGDDSAQQLAQTYREVFPEIVLILPGSSPNSHHHSSNAETVEKY